MRRKPGAGGCVRSGFASQAWLFLFSRYFACGSVAVIEYAFVIIETAFASVTKFSGRIMVASMGWDVTVLLLCVYSCT